MNIWYNMIYVIYDKESIVLDIFFPYQRNRRKKSSDLLCLCSVEGSRKDPVKFIISAIQYIAAAGTLISSQAFDWSCIMLFLMLLLYYCHPSHHFVWDNPCLVDLNDVPLADANSTWYLKPLLLLILTLVRICYLCWCWGWCWYWWWCWCWGWRLSNCVERLLDGRFTLICFWVN